MKYNFERFFDLSLDMLCIAGTDGFFKRVNDSFQRVLGWTAEELTSRPFTEFIHADDIQATLNEVEKLASGVPTISFKNRYRCSDGSYRHLLWTAFPEVESGLLFAIARDTTDLIEANQRFQLAIEASPAALIMVDQHGIIQLVNKETERLFGYSHDQLISKAIEMLVPASYHGQHRQDRDSFFQDPSTRLMGSGRLVQARRKDGEVFPAEIGLNPVQFSDGAYVLCTVLDLTLQKQIEQRRIQLAQDLEQANEKLSQLAVTDQLTTVLNRRALDEQLGNHVQLMRRMSRVISFLMLDIDHFKGYNDQYGHPAGDEVLKIVANLLQENTRATDVVARYGGEEFAIVLPNANEADAMRIAEKLRVKIKTHHWKQKKLTISIGASTMFFGEKDENEKADLRSKLISEADQALYLSKNSGRDRITHFSDMQKTEQQA